MEEVDNIILLSLRQIGTEIDGDVTSLKREWGARCCCVLGVFAGVCAQAPAARVPAVGACWAQPAGDGELWTSGPPPAARRCCGARLRPPLCHCHCPRSPTHNTHH